MEQLMQVNSATQGMLVLVLKSLTAIGINGSAKVP